VSVKLLPIGVMAAAVLLLAAIGACFALLQPNPGSRVESGVYSTVQEAEAAIGFSIPHARNLGKFRLDQVVVLGAEPPSSSGDSVLGELGRNGDPDAWAIGITYLGPDDSFITVSVTPTDHSEIQMPSSDLAAQVEINGQPVMYQREAAGAVVNASWFDKFGIVASGFRGRSAVFQAGQSSVSETDVLRLIQSIR
jgi:hypothetical protein